MTDEIQQDQPNEDVNGDEREASEEEASAAPAEAEADESEADDVETDEAETVEASVGNADAEEGEEEGDGADAPDNVVRFPSNATDHVQVMRMAEALLFAASEPLDIDSIAARLPEGADVGAAIEDLQKLYEERGVNLIRIANKWMFRTSDDMAFLMEREAVSTRKLSRAAMETLAIIAYHQPVTRAEIEEIRGVSVSKGTLDVLMETEWVRLRGRRRTPGRPVTYGTTEEFLVHFGLENVGDLPGAEELKAAGLLDGRLPAGFEVPTPNESGGDGDGDFSDDEPITDEYGAALDEHLSAGGDED